MSKSNKGTALGIALLLIPASLPVADEPAKKPHQTRVLSRGAARSASSHTGKSGKEEVGPKGLDSALLEGLWTDLASQDADRAYRAITVLREKANSAVTLLGTRLSPITAPDRDGIRQVVLTLDHPKHRIRENAQRELERLGDMAIPVLQEALRVPASEELRRRAQDILARLKGPITYPDTLRALRCLDILEAIANDEARRILDRLAHGARGHSITRAAQATLERMRQGGKLR